MDQIARPADQPHRRAVKTFRLHEKETVRKIVGKPRSEASIAIRVNLDQLLLGRQMTVSELAERVDKK